MFNQKQNIMEYLEFIKNKKHLLGNFGFEVNYLPDIAFDLSTEQLNVLQDYK